DAGIVVHHQYSRVGHVSPPALAVDGSVALRTECRASHRKGEWPERAAPVALAGGGATAPIPYVITGRSFPGSRGRGGARRRAPAPGGSRRRPCRRCWSDDA